MRITKSPLPLLLTLLGVLAAPASAMAMNLSMPHNVFIRGTTAVPWIHVGTVEAVDIFDNGLGACQYTLQWISAGTPFSSTNLFLDETKTAGNFDCEENSMRNFDTLLTLSATPPSRGINRFQQVTPISALVMSERAGGGTLAEGTVQFATGGVYAIRIN